MATWPGTLPQALHLGATETAQKAFLRTQMDAGPYKQRGRFTAAVRYLSGTMLLTQAQRQTFDTFYRSTLGYGSDAFDWHDPVDGSVVSMRFVEVPAFTAVNGGGTGSPGAAASLWSVDLQLEILPA